ncbi:MAG: LPS export ABC transporter periplasmic protein LptC [Acidobacteria bacterium]|nr:LPS export ABC transporter periplasmic protein LptC [Acidobacteriota bacterium]
MLRARLPLIAKTVALVVFLGVATMLGIQLVKRMNAVPPAITIKPNLNDAKLNAVFNNFKYDYHEGRTRYRLTAAKDTVFSDSRHELEQVKLELFDEAGETSGQVTSELCKYDQSKAILRFEKNVVIDTKDGLQVKTESLDYDQTTGNAETQDKVEFTRDKISGSCIGVILESDPKRLEMKESVYIKVEPASENKTSPQNVTKPVEITGNWGEYTADEQVIRLKGKAKIAEPDRLLSADTLIAYLTEDKKIQYVEAHGASHLESKQEDSLKLDANDMEFSFDELGKLSQAQAWGNSRLESKKTDSTLKVASEDMDFSFSPEGKLSQAEARGQSRLENQGKGTPLEVNSENMSFLFNELGFLTIAKAQENVTALTTEGPKRILTADELTVFTKPTTTTSEVERIKAVGNVNLTIAAPEPTETLPNPSTKHLKATQAEVFYYPGGEFLREAQAHGDTVLTITPIKEIPGAEKRIMRAEHNTLTFFESGNAVRELNAQGKVKLEIETIAKAGSIEPARISQSEKAKASFDKTSGEMLQALQEGNFKYTEGSRNALANKANYDATKKLIELRDGKVMVWDEQARTQADEIDMWTEKKESFARGKVRSTYYNPEGTGQATPFRNMKAPVFITSKDLHVFNERGEAIYTGDARAWQDDNFVRAEKLELFRDNRKMIATGNVSSALYQAKKALSESRESKEPKEPKETKETKEPKEGKNNQVVVPIFATSDVMDYSDKDRLAQYKGSVKMKQGNEILEANQVKIFLETEVNEMKRLEAFEKVVLTQPGRRGEGDEAEYNAYDQRTILTGNMAKVVSDLQGTITGRRLTLLGGDDRILVDDQRGTRRVKSTHEVQR